MSTDSIPIKELARIPFLRLEGLGELALPTLSFYTPDSGWELWLDVAGSLRRLKGIPGEADYFARLPESEGDLCLKFYNFIGKRALFPTLLPSFRALRRDIHNVGASLAKIDYFVEEHRKGDSSVVVTRFAETEIEYLLIVCRSMFDLFQRFFAKFWRSVGLDGTARKSQLPSSFAQLIAKGNRPRPAHEMAADYGLSAPIVEALVAAASFFFVDPECPRSDCTPWRYS